MFNEDAYGWSINSLYLRHSIQRSQQKSGGLGVDFIDDKIRDLLTKIPSECSRIDYKVVPYDRAKDHEFIRDVIAMLNSEEGINKEKFIIFGVTNERKLRGIDIAEWRDDNEWQHLLDKIKPRPLVTTGIVKLNEKVFGYIYIYSDNNEWVYEAGETVIGNKNAAFAEKNGVFKGQAFTRYGSVNRIMLDKERNRLINRHTIKKPSFSIADYQVSANEVNCIIAAALIGTWNENYSGDKAIISEFAGLDYIEFNNVVKSIYLYNSESFSVTDRTWKIKDHINTITTLANKVLDEHIESFFKIAVKVFTDADPKYDLKQNERYAVALFPNIKQKVYSMNILEGIAEAIAILGNNQDKFKNCSAHKISKFIRDFEFKIFMSKDWKIYATISDQFVCLGEACPDVFLDRVRTLLEQKDETFITFLNEKSGTLFSSSPYCYRLKWVLGLLAQEEKYFARAMHVLMLLATVHEDFLNTLIDIIVPWYPQTHADVNRRVGILRGFSRNYPDLTWKVLMQLMPNVTTSVCPLQEPKFMKIEPLPKGASNFDYITATNGYIELACSLLNGNPERMAELLNVNESVSKDTQEMIVLEIENEAKKLKYEDKEYFWNKIQDFLNRQNRLKGSFRALSQEILNLIKKMAEELFFDTKELRARRLFIKKQYTLVTGKTDLVKEQDELFEQQKEVIKKIYEMSGKDGVFDFISKVEYPVLAGKYIAIVFTDIDLKTIIKNENSGFDPEVISSVVNSLPLNRLQKLISDFSDVEKANVFSKSCLTDQIIQETEMLEESARERFWMKAGSFGSELKELINLQIAIDNFNKFMRPEASLEVLFYRLENYDDKVPVNLVIDVLEACTRLQKIDQMQVYYLKELIKWLQNQNIEIEQKALFEWKYFYAIDGYSGFDPVYLWQLLSKDAVFFAEILKKSREKIPENAENDLVNNKEFQIQMSCYRILRNWKNVPGLQSDNRVDTILLKKWIDNVKDAVGDEYLFGIAMYYLGRSLFHTPADRTGFFIDIPIATILEEDEEGNLRIGYYEEACNGQGAQFVDFTGKSDFKTESAYNEKARAAETEGFYKFAETLRKIAAYYHEEGESNIRSC